jgi:internalin A
LPDAICSMTNLRVLNCSYNELTILPDFICHLTNLTYLDCVFNKLTFLPESIDNLTNLINLYCFNNNLLSLPDSIGNLINLQYLDCSNNNLTSLPPSIGNLSLLKVLHFDISITELPHSIINLRNIIMISSYSRMNLTPEQERYFNWIKSNKLTVFDEYCDMTLVKCAYKCS